MSQHLVIVISLEEYSEFEIDYMSQHLVIVISLCIWMLFFSCTFLLRVHIWLTEAYLQPLKGKNGMNNTILRVLPIKSLVLN